MAFAPLPTNIRSTIGDSLDRANTLIAGNRQKFVDSLTNLGQSFSGLGNSVSQMMLQKRLNNALKEQQAAAQAEAQNKLNADIAGDQNIVNMEASSPLHGQAAGVDVTPFRDPLMPVEAPAMTDDMERIKRAMTRQGMETGYEAMPARDAREATQAFQTSEREATQDFQTGMERDKRAYEQQILDEAEAPAVEMIENPDTNALDFAQALERRGAGKADDIIDSAMTPASLNKMKNVITGMVNQGKLTPDEANSIIRNIGNAPLKNALPLAIATLGRFLGVKDPTIPAEAIRAEMQSLRLQLADTDKLRTRLENDLRPNVRNQVRDKRDLAELEALEQEFGGQQ